MSETAPAIYPEFPRQVPSEASNDLINKAFKEAMEAAISKASANGKSGRDEYIDRVIEGVLLNLGEGAVMARIEEVARAFPDRYVKAVPRNRTSLKYVTRADYRSFAHPAVLSPILAVEMKDGRTCYIGTDKLGHMAQQGYDYFVISKIAESRHKGLGELYARAWGVWTEGEELSGEEIGSYLDSRGLPSDEAVVKKIQKDLREFFTGSEEIKFMSPTPLSVMDNAFLRKLAHAVGTHEKGILGYVSTGIFSYADLEANEAGFKFYLDLEKDPEKTAENFDIRDYATCRWDEEELPSKRTPLIEKRIREAVEDNKMPDFQPGLGLNYDVLRNFVSLSLPVIYRSFADTELRLRLGGAIHISSSLNDFKAQSNIFSALDFLVRLKNLHYLYVTGQAGLNSEACPKTALGIGYELMLLGKTSFQAGPVLDPIEMSPSFQLGLLWFF